MTEFLRLLPLFFGIGYLVALFFLRRQRRRWSELAEVASLEFDPGGFIQPVRVFGAYRGRPVLIDTTMRRGHKRWIYYTRVQLPTHGLEELSLKAYKKSGLVGRLAKKLQPTEHVAIGDDLTKEYGIELKPPRFAATLMGNDSPFQRLFKQIEVHILQAANDELYFETLGVHHDKDKMLAVINILVDVAEHCESVIEEALPRRSSQRKALSSEKQYLEKKQITKRQKYGTLFIVILVGLLSLLPYICLALFEWRF
jgi:hypothetical protein